MANDAQKKRNAKTSSLLFFFGLSLAVINAVYLLCHFFLFSEASESFWKDLGIHSLLSVVLLYQILTCARHGYDFQYYFDAMVVNLLVQTLSLYSDNAWYLFLAIPAFIVFKVGGFLVRYLRGSSGPAEEVDPLEKARLEKAQSKKQRKEDRLRARGAIMAH